MEEFECDQSNAIVDLQKLSSC